MDMDSMDNNIDTTDYTRLESVHLDMLIMKQFLSTLPKTKDYTKSIFKLWQKR